MKKFVSIVLVMMLILTASSCFADTHESPILFRNAKWGSNYSTVLSLLPEGVKMYSPKVSEYWRLTDDRMFDESSWDYYKAELGCYAYSKSSSMKNVKVAGYEVDTIYLYFLYEVGADGLLIKDDTHTSLMYAYYKLEPKDPDAVYADLVAKLTSLYGDVDLHQQRSPYITYEQNLWYGADGTMVSLVKEDYPSGSHYIYIKYGVSGADEQIKAAYDAVVLEETKNAASDTDGL